MTVLIFLTMTYITILSVIRPWAQHDQPIDWIEPNSTSRLAQVEAKVECWVRKTSRSTRTLSHQDPFLMRHGSQPTANRPPHLVASCDTQGGAEDVFYPDVPTGGLQTEGKTIELVSMEEPVRIHRGDSIRRKENEIEDVDLRIH